MFFVWMLITFSLSYFRTNSFSFKLVINYVRDLTVLHVLLAFKNKSISIVKEKKKSKTVKYNFFEDSESNIYKDKPQRQATNKKDPIDVFSNILTIFVFLLIFFSIAYFSTSYYILNLFKLVFIDNLEEIINIIDLDVPQKFKVDRLEYANFFKKVNFFFYLMATK